MLAQKIRSKIQHHAEAFNVGLGMRESHKDTSFCFWFEVCVESRCCSTLWSKTRSIFTFCHQWILLLLILNLVSLLIAAYNKVLESTFSLPLAVFNANQQIPIFSLHNPRPPPHSSTHCMLDGGIRQGEHFLILILVHSRPGDRKMIDLLHFAL